MSQVTHYTTKTMFPIPHYITSDLDEELRVLFVRIHIRYEYFEESYEKLKDLDSLFKDKYWYSNKVICTFEEIEDGNN